MNPTPSARRRSNLTSRCPRRLPRSTPPERRNQARRPRQPRLPHHRGPHDASRSSSPQSLRARRHSTRRPSRPRLCRQPRLPGHRTIQPTAPSPETRSKGHSLPRRPPPPRTQRRETQTSPRTVSNATRKQLGNLATDRPSGPDPPPSVRPGDPQSIASAARNPSHHATDRRALAPLASSAMGRAPPTSTRNEPISTRNESTPRDTNRQPLRG